MAQPGAQIPRQTPADHQPGDDRRDDAGSNRHQFRLLVVDDEPAILELAARILTRAGFEVTKANSGSVALRLLAADTDLDLVLTDLAMPGTGGLDVAVEARRARPGIAVLFMSGFVSSDVLEALDAPVVAKPFTAVELVGAVREALRPRANGGA